jgi:fused signal recognition particle receptor
METALVAILVLAVIVGLYFFFQKKPAELPEGEREKSLPAKKEEKKEGPTLQDKLDARRSEMKPEKAKDEPKPAPKKAEEPAPEPKKAEEPAPEPKKAEPAPEPVAAPEPKKEERAPAATPAPRPTRPGNVEGMRKGLAKSRAKEGFFGRLASLVVGKKEIDPALVSELEEVLLTSDVGVKTTEALLARVKDGLAKNELSDPARVWDALRAEASRILSVGGGGIVLSAKPTVVMMVGVNGAGKTTTIGKIATKLNGEGRKVVLAAGDTFRAAAVQQLEVWGKRVGCEVVKGKDGADPAAVAFDAVSKAKAADADIVIVDTAGRLHTKSNLMDELRKIGKSAGKAIDGAPHETLLVIDATNGQNALAQATQFKEAMPLTGIVLTKLDGTAKGGVILSICDELGLPVRYVGLGERSDDLHEFSAEEYVEALFGDAGRDS